MSRKSQRLLDLLDGYLRNVDFYLSVADLTDEEYYRLRRWLSGHARASESALKKFKSELVELRDYVAQCQDSGNEVAIEMLMKMRMVANEVANDRLDEYRPMIERGAKELRDGRKANEVTYGTHNEREQKYQKWQEMIDAMHADDPTMTYGAMLERVARKCTVGKSTVEKHTVNPKKKSQ